jgi:hypothetical protein
VDPAILNLGLFVLCWIVCAVVLKMAKQSAIIVVAGSFLLSAVLCVLVFAFLEASAPEVALEPGVDYRVAPQAQQADRQELIEEQFSAWDGSHFNLTERIKSSMNDPSSYEHVDTRYVDNGDHLLVMTTFRGANAFGGVVKNTVAAKVKIDGTILEVTQVE